MLLVIENEEIKTEKVGRKGKRAPDSSAKESVEVFKRKDCAVNYIFITQIFCITVFPAPQNVFHLF